MKLKKAIATALMLMTVTATSSFANEISEGDLRTGGNDQIYSFTYDSPQNQGSRDFETRKKISSNNHGHIKLSKKPAKYNLKTIFIKKKGGSQIMSSPIIIKNTGVDTYMGIPNKQDYAKDTTIATRLWNASNISTAQRYVGTVNYH